MYAPESRPITSGLPIELRVRFWNRAPATPRAAPKTSAASTRGSRHSRTTTDRSPVPASPASTSDGGLQVSPWLRPPTSASRAATARAVTRNLTVPSLRNGDRPDQHRGAEEGGDDRDRHLAGGQQPRHHVGEHQQDRAEQQRVPDHPRHRAVGEPAREMRDHQADEGDRPGDRRGRAGQQRDQHENHNPGTRDVRAQGLRGVLAERDHAERPRHHEGPGQSREQHDRRKQLRAAVHAGERADRPVPVFVEHVRPHQPQAERHAGEHCAERDPGQDQPQRRGAAYRVHQNRCRRAACDGQCQLRGRAVGQAGEHAQVDREPRAGSRCSPRPRLPRAAGPPRRRGRRAGQSSSWSATPCFQ